MSVKAVTILLRSTESEPLPLLLLLLLTVTLNRGVKTKGICCGVVTPEEENRPR